MSGRNAVLRRFSKGSRSSDGLRAVTSISDYRWATADPRSISNSVAELVALAPDVILASATEALAACQKATSTIPIVFVSVSDPVGQGFVNSLESPGGHITGFTAFEFSMGGKWMELLKEIAPSVRHVAVLFNPQTAPYFALFMRSIKAAAAELSGKLGDDGMR